MKSRTVLAAIAGVTLLALNAQAISIGALASADRLLGIVVPGQPTSEADEVGMINYLLTQTSDGTGGVNGWNWSGILTVLDNPNDSGVETYTLFTVGVATSIPKPAPIADLTLGSMKDEVTPEDLFVLPGGDWLVAKYGQDNEVFYIGNLPVGTEIRVAASSTGGGLSHWSIYNIADGGATLLLLGLCTLGLSAVQRKTAAK